MVYRKKSLIECQNQTLSLSSTDEAIVTMHPVESMIALPAILGLMLF